MHICIYSKMPNQKDTHTHTHCKYVCSDSPLLNFVYRVKRGTVVEVAVVRSSGTYAHKILSDNIVRTAHNTCNKFSTYIVIDSRPVLLTCTCFSMLFLSFIHVQFEWLVTHEFQKTQTETRREEEERKEEGNTKPTSVPKIELNQVQFNESPFIRSMNDIRNRVVAFRKPHEPIMYISVYQYAISHGHIKAKPIFGLK